MEILIYIYIHIFLIYFSWFLPCPGWSSVLVGLNYFLHENWIGSSPVGDDRHGKIHHAIFIGKCPSISIRAIEKPWLALWMSFHQRVELHHWVRFFFARWISILVGENPKIPAIKLLNIYRISPHGEVRFFLEFPTDEGIHPPEKCRWGAPWNPTRWLAWGAA